MRRFAIFLLSLSGNSCSRPLAMPASALDGFSLAYDLSGLTVADLAPAMVDLGAAPDLSQPSDFASFPGGPYDLSFIPSTGGPCVQSEGVCGAASRCKPPINDSAELSALWGLTEAQVLATGLVTTGGFIRANAPSAPTVHNASARYLLFKFAVAIRHRPILDVTSSDCGDPVAFVLDWQFRLVGQNDDVSSTDAHARVELGYQENVPYSGLDAPAVMPFYVLVRDYDLAPRTFVTALENIAVCGGPNKLSCSGGSVCLNDTTDGCITGGESTSTCFGICASPGSACCPAGNPACSPGPITPCTPRTYPRKTWPPSPSE